MNKELKILETQYFDLSRKFLAALQNDRPSEELEAIRQQIRSIMMRMEELNGQQQSTSEGSVQE